MYKKTHRWVRFFILDVLVTNQQEYNVIYTNIASLF